LGSQDHNDKNPAVAHGQEVNYALIIRSNFLTR